MSEHSGEQAGPGLMPRAVLEQRILEGIPLATAMNFRVMELDDTSITVCGGGNQNINVHGTAFAGSLYAVCTLAAWGLVTARLPEGASVVMQEGAIRYRRPVIGDIVARCELDAQTLDSFVDTVARTGRGRIQAEIIVPAEKGPAVEFMATVHARMP
ncbi:MAG: YiiD C-terminal domain-containing protein [Chromatiales bacterium]|nr:YiiD C-terminal domain-containing protein [Chromatiales bacterium]